MSRDHGKAKTAAGSVMIGYDDICSIQYFGENLRPYWNADGKSSIEEQFAKARKEETELIARCYDFDRKLMREAEKAGGRDYAELCALAYRQAIHAHKLVKAPNGDLLWVSRTTATAPSEQSMLHILQRLCSCCITRLWQKAS